ncbi:Lon protease family protein [Roseibium sp.]|uniref:Lon protease family protein n=1 Tax=Roseibium sp. TaxID=1936156 RepID=UPI003A97E23D
MTKSNQEWPTRGQTKLPSALETKDLYRSADLSSLDFKITSELEPLDGLMGQRRASDAIDVALSVPNVGFNLFVLGTSGRLARDAVTATLKNSATRRQTADDWIYVNNFADTSKPIAIALPCGRAPAFRASMEELVDDLTVALPAVFQSEEYQAQVGTINDRFQTIQGEAFAELQKRASDKSIALLRTPMGFALVPAKDGKVVPPDEFNSLPEEERGKFQGAIGELEGDLERLVRQIPRWEKERREEIRKLNSKTSQATVDPEINEVIAEYADLPDIVEYLEDVRADLVDNVAIFILKGDDTVPYLDEATESAFDRYRVNLFVTQADMDEGAPVIEEFHPTIGNLTGRIEHIASQGVLATNFHLIKPGALHRANGGYLLIDARDILSEAFSWSALKRALRSRTIRIEDLNQLIGLSSTTSLEPAPIPLDVKIVLFGDRFTYYLLSLYDPELKEHFKVLADFEDAMERTAESEALMARAIGSIVSREDLLPLDRDGTGLVIEHAARLVENSGKLSLSSDDIRDILAEANHYAVAAGRKVTTRKDVQQALDQRIERASRVRDLLQEQILQNVALVDTAGHQVGQINGLSVLEVAGTAFGRPTRITCRVRTGAGKVVDIEREVELGGPIHSKGVLILSGFLAGRFALDAPMSLHASLVFEQSYAGVEGDSASSAELYALLSALADLPIRQDIAVTGSVNQHGAVQAIGGVNEKIEGYFDICKARGLTGTQAVLIPASNVQHLMLRPDVIEACDQGKFAVYPVATIDEGLEFMTGLPAGERGADGTYPEGTVYRRVEERLEAFADIRRSFGKQGGSRGET